MELIIWDFLGTLYNANLGTLYPGTKELLLKSSKKYRHILSSSGFNKTKRLALIKNLGLDDLFVQIDVGLKTKKQFLNYCNKYNCKPKNVFVIGDNAFNEIKLGNSLGMKTIWINSHKRKTLSEKIFRTSSWKEVEKIEQIERLLKI